MTAPSPPRLPTSPTWDSLCTRDHQLSYTLQAQCLIPSEHSPCALKAPL